MSINVKWKRCFSSFLLCLSSLLMTAQADTLHFWDIPSSLHKGRFWTAAGTGAVFYTGALISLNQIWYKQYPRTSFHLFNDAKEWQQMDKAGHLFTTYFEADWAFHVFRWTGMKRSSSIWAGALVATGMQATVEMLDGFSSEWGFSPHDFASNLAGSAFWATQQAVWDEQRIRMKVSSTFRSYPEDIVYGNPAGTTTIRDRAKDLYGRNILQTFLKDYNAQTIWMSVNVHSFLKNENRFPTWLNIAVGYGAENMFGGFENQWISDGNVFALSDEIYPRHRQWYLSPDIDLSKIKTRSKPLKVLLGMANIFKFPAPALEMNGKGALKWRWMYY